MIGPMLWSPIVFTTLCLALLGAGTAWGDDSKNWQGEFREQATALFKSLEDKEQVAILKPADDPARTERRFPGGRRPGLRYGDLSAAQQKVVDGLISHVLSAEGREVLDAICEQGAGGGRDRLWITLFGNPTKEDFALRIAEHHLTLVNVAVRDGTLEVGPLLLGANPPKLFQKEERALLDIWSKLEAKELKRMRTKGVGGSGRLLREKEGYVLADLNEMAQEAFQQALDCRLVFLAAPLQQAVRNVITPAKEGGVRVLFYNEEPKKRCQDGGRWDFKAGIAGKALWDWQGSNGHLHLTLWVKGEFQGQSRLR